MTQHFFARRVAPAYGIGSSSIRSRRLRQPVLAAGLVTIGSVGLAGCADSRGEAGNQATEAIAAEVPTIRNVMRDSGSGAWTVGPELRVGVLDGETAFGRIADVAPRGAGGMWVLDAQSRLISGFDETGALAVRFGGEGDGPGELRNAASVFETAAGHVAVGSPFPPALHWFEVEGAYLESARVTESFDSEGNPLPPRFAVWAVTRTGRAFADLFSVPRPGAGPFVSHDVVGFAGHGLADAHRDTIVTWEVPATPASPSAPLPIVPVSGKWTTGPGDLVWWTPGRPYEIHAIDATGDPVRAITLDREAVPVTQDVRDAIAAGLRRSAGSGPGGIGLVENALARAEWPEALPHLAGIWVSDPDGRVFAAPYSASSFDPSAVLTLDVFEADGSYSGSLRLPPAYSPRRFAGGAVYGVETDELGVNYAVRYRIEREK